MKKLIFIMLLIFAPTALGQSVGASQIKKKTGGGLVGDTSNALTVGVYRGTSAPVSPLAGQLWCDTTYTPCALKMYSGSAWTVTPNSSGILTADSFTSFPGTPSDGQLYYTRNPRTLWIYDATAGQWFGGTGWWTAGAFNVPTETLDPTQTITTPVTAITDMATVAGGNIRQFAYSFKYTCATATGGETLASPASASYTPTSASISISMTVPVCGTGTSKRFIYSTKEGGDVTGPWYQIGLLNDNTTTSFTWDLRNWGPSTSINSSEDRAFGNNEPAQAYTGLLPAAYSTWNGLAYLAKLSYPEYSGGCGVTANSQIYCRRAFTGNPSPVTTVNPYFSLRRSIADNADQNYMIEYRLTYGILPPSDYSISIYDWVIGLVETNTAGTRGLNSFMPSTGANSSIDNLTLYGRYVAGTQQYAGLNASFTSAYPRFLRSLGHSIWIRIYHYNISGQHIYYLFISQTKSIWLGGTTIVFNNIGESMKFLELIPSNGTNGADNWGDYRNGAVTFDQFSLTLF